jgi:NDP-4-keto-2,6-dideoxyhexose 3-C-methyltransferase
MYKKLEKCRICGNPHLVEVLDLGIQTLTGIFPARVDEKITQGPLVLVKCMGGNDSCGLLQLAHSYDLGEMYGDNYGYRSGLNQSMVRHLHGKVSKILQMVDFTGRPVVLDIGSNDGTTLGAYPADTCVRIGMDPTAKKFREYYPQGVTAIADFFTAERFQDTFPGQRARVVTSFSMFYDLERPLDFMREIASILEDNGLWVFEQSYMPLMLELNSYDTVCHEHLEYYALKQIKWMADRAGFKIVDVEFNDINGGSFSVAVAKQKAPYSEFTGLQALLDNEIKLGLDTLAPYHAFAARTALSRETLRGFIEKALAEGKRIAGLGASTKGNVLLQYCGLGKRELFAIGEVNPYKYGRFAPGTLIPIVPESELLTDEPDYLVVLPWHFRSFFVEKYKLRKAKLVFPLPTLQVV